MFRKFKARFNASSRKPTPLPSPAPPQDAEARLLSLSRERTHLQAQLLIEVAAFAAGYYVGKAKQVVVTYADQTQALGPRLAELKADVRRLEQEAPQIVSDLLGNPGLWTRINLDDCDWWWRDDFDCDYETRDGDRALRDQLYQVFAPLPVVLARYGYRPNWRPVNIENRRALFGQEPFRGLYRNYCATLAEIRDLRRLAAPVLKQRARLEAERLWQEA